MCPTTAATTTRSNQETSLPRRTTTAADHSIPRCERAGPSPAVLMQLIAQFGPRFGPARSRAGFLLSGCAASAIWPQQVGKPAEIAIRALSFSELQFITAVAVADDEELEIVLECGSIETQRWTCKVCGVERIAAGVSHVVARFSRSRERDSRVAASGCRRPA